MYELINHLKFGLFRKNTPMYIEFFFIIIFVSLSFLTGEVLSVKVDLWNIFNSDSIYLSSVYNDVFNQKNSFFSWRLTPGPFFFPEMLFYFIFKAVVQDTFYTFIVYAIFQIQLVFFLSLSLQKILFKSYDFFNYLLSFLFLMTVGLLVCSSELSPYMMIPNTLY